MAEPVVLSPRAVTEIGEAYEWYEEQLPGLGEQFLVVLDAQIELIKASPGLYAEAIPGVRRALLKRFPYGIFYARSGEIISILAVVRTARSPRNWPRG